MAGEPKQPGQGGGMHNRRARRRRAMSRGQWAVFRERCSVDETVQPPVFTDAAPIADAVGQVLRRLGLNDVVLGERIETEWPAVVGPAVARHARPGPLQDGRLTVYVDSPVWLSELSRQHRKRILANLGARSLAVRDLLFRVDPGERQ